MNQKLSTISELENLITVEPQLRQPLLDYGWCMVNLGRTKQLLEEADSQEGINVLTQHLADLEGQKQAFFSGNSLLTSLHEQRLFPPSLLPELQRMFDEKCLNYKEESDVKEYLEVAGCLPESVLSFTDWIKNYRSGSIITYNPLRLKIYPAHLNIVQKRAWFKALKTDSSLAILEVVGELPIKFIQMLSKALKKLSLQEFHLSTHIVNELVPALANIFETATTFKKCILSDCRINGEGGVTFMKALKTNRSIEVLHFSGCAIKNEGIIEFAHVLETNTILKKLILSTRSIGPDSNISDAGATALAEGLKKNKSLEELELSSPYIQQVGLLSLAEAIKSHASLKKCTLYFAQVDEKGVAALAEIIETNTTLEEFSLPNLHSNHDSQCRIKLGQALKKNTRLKKFTVLISNCNTRAIEALAEAVETNTTLEELNLLKGDISDKGAAALIKALETNTTIIINLDQSAISDVEIELKNKLRGLIKRNKTYFESKQKIDHCLCLLKEKLSEGGTFAVREEEIEAEGKRQEEIQLLLTKAQEEALTLWHTTPRYAHAERLLHEVYCQMAMAYARYDDYPSLIALYFDHFVLHPDQEVNFQLAALLMKVEDEVFASVKLGTMDRQKFILSLLGGNCKPEADVLRSQALRRLKEIKTVEKTSFAEAAGIPNATIITFAELIALIEQQFALEKAEQLEKVEKEAYERERQAHGEVDEDEDIKKPTTSRPETLLEKIKAEKIQVAVYEHVITHSNTSDSLPFSPSLRAKRGNGNDGEAGEAIQEAVTPNEIIFVKFENGILNTEIFQESSKVVKDFQENLKKLIAIPYHQAIDADPNCFKNDRMLFPKILTQLLPAEINFIFTSVSDTQLYAFFTDLKNAWGKDESSKDTFLSALSTASMVTWTRLFNLLSLDDLSKLNLATLAEEAFVLRVVLANWLKPKLEQPSKEFLDFVREQKLFTIPGLMDLIATEPGLQQELLSYGWLMADLGATKQFLEEIAFNEGDTPEEIDSLREHLAEREKLKIKFFPRNSWLSLVSDQLVFPISIISTLIEKGTNEYPGKEKGISYRDNYEEEMEKEIKEYLETAGCLPESIFTVQEWAKGNRRVLDGNCCDISLQNLSGREIRQLLKALRTDTSIHILKMQVKHKTDIKILKALPDILKKNKTLKELNLRNRSITNDQSEALAEILKINSSITRLNLSSIALSDDAFVLLTEALKINTTLKELELDRIHLVKERVKLLGEALKVNKTLTHLNLSNNMMGDEGAKILAETLQENQFTFLDLYGNDIGIDGLKALERKLPDSDEKKKLASEVETKELNIKIAKEKEEKELKIKMEKKAEIINLAKLNTNILRHQHNRKQKRDRDFLTDMSNNPIFKELVKRIPQIEERILGGFGQDAEKNSNKAKALRFIRDQILHYNSVENSVQAFYNEIRDRDPVIRASTRSDKDFTWFPRGNVDSVPLLNEILAAFIRYDSELEKNYQESKKGEAELVSPQV